jgi:hypothetical protein
LLTVFAQIYKVKKYSGVYNIFIVAKENFELLATLTKGDFSLPLTQTFGQVSQK